MYRYTQRQDDAPAPEKDPFVRDAPTVLSYSLLACFTLWLYAFGPSLALLRDELHFSYTLLGLYSALWSLGAAMSGAGFALVARRLPRAVLLWGSAVVTVCAAGLYTVGSTEGATLLGAGLFGLAGTTLLTVIQAILSDRHRERRDRALTEANVGAGVCAVLAPLLLGVLATGPLGWRAAFAIPVVALVVLFARFARLRLPVPADTAHSDSRRRLPRASVLFAGLTAVTIAVEFCLIYFGTPMLTRTGLSTAAAATALSSNYLGILVGRLVGAVVTRRPGRAVLVLYASLAVTAVGFVVFWRAEQPAVAVAGLFACGFGIANLYPLALSLALSTADGLEDRANARTQLIGGLVAAAAPFVLGSLADRVGLVTAFGLELVLIGACLVLLTAGRRVQRSSA